MGHNQWLINDKYYGGWWRYCAGGTSAAYHRIFYR